MLVSVSNAHQTNNSYAPLREKIQHDRKADKRYKQMIQTDNNNEKQMF